jgi:hypothetical protein
MGFMTHSIFMNWWRTLVKVLEINSFKEWMFLESVDIIVRSIITCTKSVERMGFEDCFDEVYCLFWHVFWDLILLI